MVDSICGIIAPRQDELVRGEREDGYLAECILPHGHRGPHVVKTPEGKFFAWEDDWDCDCCEPEEADRCYIHWEIEEAEIPKLLKRRTK